MAKRRLTAREKHELRKIERRKGAEKVDPTKNSSRNKVRETYTDPVNTYFNLFRMLQDSEIRMKAKEQLIYERLMTEEEFAIHYQKHIDLAKRVFAEKHRIGEQVFEIPEYSLKMMQLDDYREYVKKTLNEKKKPS